MINVLITGKLFQIVHLVDNQNIDVQLEPSVGGLNCVFNNTKHILVYHALNIY